MHVRSLSLDAKQFPSSHKHTNPTSLVEQASSKEGGRPKKTTRRANVRIYPFYFLSSHLLSTCRPSRSTMPDTPTTENVRRSTCRPRNRPCLPRPAESGSRMSRPLSRRPRLARALGGSRSPPPPMIWKWSGAMTQTLVAPVLALPEQPLSCHAADPPLHYSSQPPIPGPATRGAVAAGPLVMLVYTVSWAVSRGAATGDQR